MGAKLARRVAELDTDDAQPGDGQFVSPAHILGVCGRTHDHAPAVGVEDGRQGTSPLRGLVDEQTDVVAVNAGDDLGASSDAAHGRQTAEGLGVDRTEFGLDGADVVEYLRIRGIGAYGRRLSQSGVHARHGRDQPGVEARVGGERQVRVPQSPRQHG